MKKGLSLLMVFVIALSCFNTPAIAAEMEGNSLVESFPEIIGADKIIVNSIRKTNNGAIISTSYTSAEYNTGVSGYTYQLSFDCVFEEISGEYVFKSIENVDVVLKPYHIILLSLYATYSATVSSLDWDYSENRDSVTFEFAITFDTLQKDTLIHHHTTEKHTLKKTADELI